MIFLLSVIFTVPVANAQPGIHTAKTGSEILRLIRNEKFDLILPGAMRENNVDMWIHITRNGDPDPLTENFGLMSSYLIFTDLGNRIERAVFGSAGTVENVDIRGSNEISMAIAGYKYRTEDFSVYDELRDFVAERDPQTIAVNTSDWLTADEMTFEQKVQLRLATLLAVMTSLHLARRGEKVRLKIAVGIRRIIRGDKSPREDHVCFDVTNVGERPVIINNTAGWVVRKAEEAQVLHSAPIESLGAARLF